MATSDFRQNVQTARNVLFSHMLVHSAKDPLPPDRQAADSLAVKRSAPLWLSPRVVAGFDPSEWDDPADESMADLTEAVRAYREVAETVAGREPTDDELRRGQLEL